MKIFVISLPESHERRCSIESQLANIEFEFFAAEDLRSTDDHFIYDFYSPYMSKKNKGYELKKSELGCFASHVALWERCVFLNQPILILEDNALIDNGFFDILDFILCDVLKFGVIKLDRRFDRDFKFVKKFSENYNLVSYLKAVCGTSGYAISPVAAANYLKHINGFFEPVDDFMEKEWFTKQTVYSIHPPVVHRSNVNSVIGVRKEKEKLNIKSKIDAEIYRVYKKIRQKWYNYLNK